jgi:hypothetical protein
MAQPPLADGPEPRGPAVLGPGAPPAAPRKYRQLYSDPDRARGLNLAEYLAGYRFNEAPDGVAIPTPAALFEQTVPMCDRWPMAFLCLVPRGGGQLVRVVHRFIRYVDLPGELPTGLHDTVLGLLGDIRPGLYPFVEVPNSVFRVVTAPAVVPTDGLLLQALVADEGAAAQPAVRLVGPYPVGAENIEVVRPRHIQLVPGKYAALVLNGDGMPPLTAYRTIRAALVEDNALDSCADVLTWLLRAACTIRGGGGDRANLPSVQTTFNPTHPPDSVYDFVMQKVQGDLPALRAPEPPNDRRGAAAPPAQLGADIAGLVRALTEARGKGGGGVIDEMMARRGSPSGSAKCTEKRTQPSCAIAESTMRRRLPPSGADSQTPLKGSSRQSYTMN